MTRNTEFGEFTNKFFKQNVHLFNILGIFGAVSVYLMTISSESTMEIRQLFIDIGIVSSLLLFLSVGMLINKRFRKKHREVRGFTLKEKRKENIMPLFTSGLFLLILLSVLCVVVITIGWPLITVVAIVILLTVYWVILE